MRSVLTVLCFDTALSAQFIGDISLIPSGLHSWVALYVDPRSNKAADFFSPPSPPAKIHLSQPATAALAASSLCTVMPECLTEPLRSTRLSSARSLAP